MYDCNQQDETLIKKTGVHCSRLISRKCLKNNTSYITFTEKNNDTRCEENSCFFANRFHGKISPR